MTEEKFGADALEAVGDEAPEAGRTEVLPAIRETQAVDRSQIGGILRPVAKPEEMLQAQEETRAMIATILKEGRDYKTIPGTSKPTLVKPGAERTNAAFGCMARFEIIEKEVDHDRLVQFVKRSWEWHPETRGKKVWTEEAGESQGLYRYVILCELVHRASGLVIGTGVGSCSTMESKYIDRPRDLENTILKMGKKRAYIDATLTAFGLSEQFTQDVEDMPREHFTSGNGQDSAEEWSLDSPGIGKQCDGRNWREMCEKDPGYVQWAIGRKDFAGMDKLSKDQRETLGAELDRLAEEEDAGTQGEGSGSPPPSYTKEEVEGFLATLKGSKPDTGKHVKETWFEIYSSDLDYFKKTLTHGWGAHFRADLPLVGALNWAVSGGIERLKLEPTPEHEPEEAVPSVVWTSLVDGCDMAGLDAFAEMHPDLPSEMNYWTEDDYQTAVDAFRKVEHKGGAQYAVRKASEALAAKKAPSSGGSDTVSDGAVIKGTKTLTKAVEAGIDVHPWEARLNEAIQAIDEGAYLGIVEELRDLYFRTKAGKA